MCVSLTHLYICGNPLERAPNVLLIIASIITSLVEIDGSAVDPAALSRVTNAMILEAASAMRLIQEDIDDERRLESNMMEDGSRDVRQVVVFYFQHFEVVVHGKRALGYCY